MHVEARLIESGAKRVFVHRTGMGPQRAMAAAQRLRQIGGGALVVVGFCGALETGMRPGEVIVADRVHTAADEGHEEVDLACAGADGVAAALGEAGLTVRLGQVVCVGRLALGDRRGQLLQSGAVAVDMESAWLADGAGPRPFGVVRVVLDTPERELLRPQMLPLALRAGAALRRTARALERAAAEQGVHTLFGAAGRAPGVSVP